MKILKYFALAVCTMVFTTASCQPPVSSDAQNKIDTLNRKQGTWVFRLQDGAERMRCMYKNDSLHGARTYTLDSATTLERFPAENKQERFVFRKGTVSIQGWFETPSGTIHVEEGRSTGELDTTVQYLMGIPALYASGTKNIMDEVDNMSAPLKKTFKNNKAVVEIAVDRNGKVTSVTMKLDKPDKKLEGALLPRLEKLDSWQPAFNTWQTQPYKKQIIINF